MHFSVLIDMKVFFIDKWKNISMPYVLFDKNVSAILWFDNCVELETENIKFMDDKLME